MGRYYGDAKMKGAKLDISKWKRPSPETIPVHAKAAGLYMICTMSKHAAEAKGCSDALFMDYRGYVAEATGANIFFVKDGEVHTPTADVFLNGITRQTVIGMLEERQVKVHQRHIMPGRAGKLRAVLADRHGGGGHAGGPDRRLQLRGRRDDPGRGDGVRGAGAGVKSSGSDEGGELDFRPHPPTILS
jgi:hypothetical protein